MWDEGRCESRVRGGGILAVARRAPPVRGQDRVHLTSFITYEGSSEPPLPDARGPGHSSRRLVMPVRELPAHPNVRQLKHQAKDLLRAARAGEPAALAAFAEFHPEPIDPRSAKLADAHLVLARSYQAASWPQLMARLRRHRGDSRQRLRDACAGSLARTPRSCTIGTAVTPAGVRAMVDAANLALRRVVMTHTGTRRTRRQ